MTTRIRLYGTDCEQFRNVQQAISDTKTNIHVYAGIYIDGMSPTYFMSEGFGLTFELGNDTTYTRQRDEAFAVLDKYGVDNILGVTVGNEYLLQASQGGSLSTAQTYLIEKINEVRTMIKAKGYSKTIPVGSADAGSMITADLAAAADYVSLFAIRSSNVLKSPEDHGQHSPFLLWY